MQASTCQALVIGVIIFKAKEGWISVCGLLVDIWISVMYKRQV